MMIVMIALRVLKNKLNWSVVIQSLLRIIFLVPNISSSSSGKIFTMCMFGLTELLCVFGFTVNLIELW